MVSSEEGVRFLGVLFRAKAGAGQLRASQHSRHGQSK